MIRINGLHKYFNKGKSNEIHVINGVDLNLEERGMVAIFGKSGCGKTTLLNVIGGLDRFAEGKLEIDGKNIRENTDDLRNQYIGYIFQNYNLNKAESCFDNVADALRLCGIEDEEVIRERVMVALANVGMEKYVKRTPDTLSGGQQQRIAIARAIVKNPRIILADEPTGNLDEANTVMIMDLLKAISKDHLVLLVTHEANLVDYYCDTVIELSDGQIVDVRQNASANGFAARDKNAIYLGELEKTTVSSENADVEFYGPAPDAPIKLTIVNNGGHLYIKLGSNCVQMLDETSEVYLIEGVYEEKANANSVSESIDMSKLPRAVGTRFGHLFSFNSSVKSGYFENFKRRKKGKKLLKNCMILFSAVIVLMTAFFGTAFSKIIDADKAYNHNVFYVYAKDGEVSKKLNSVLGKADSGIDYINIMETIPYGDINITFLLGGFETFEMRNYESNFNTNAVLLGSSIATNLTLVEGKRDGLELEEAFITTAIADALLEKSTFNHIKEYSDLIGMVSNSVSIGGKNIRVAGILESNEKAVYLSDLALAKYQFRNNLMKVFLDSDYGEAVSPGEIMLVATKGTVNGFPSLGEQLAVRGKDFKLSNVKTISTNYSEYLKDNSIEKYDNFEAYCKVLIKEKYPEISENESQSVFDRVYEESYFDYFDYYYSEYSDYVNEFCRYSHCDIETWLYAEKGIEDMKYVLIGDESYYLASKYKEKHGEYPTLANLDKESGTFNLFELSSKYINKYNDEYNMTYRKNAFATGIYLVCEADYIELSHIYGESHKSVSYNNDNYSYYEDNYYSEEILPAKSVSVEVDSVVTVSGNPIVYAMIHSTDPELTQSFLDKEFSDLTPPQDYLAAIVTPNQIYGNLISDNLSSIITSVISMAIILALMSVCMYFIMRSSLMNRIKEVGVYRAIGVSKKNLVFKFFVEAVLLTTLTVFVGYILTSAFVFVCLSGSSMVREIFYYPVWLALVVLAVLYSLSLFCGTLPIRRLLRKTPSEILAKYDI